MKQRTDRWWNFIAVFCLLAALVTTSYRLETTHWTKELYILKWQTVIAFVLGLGFGYSYFSAFKSGVLIFWYSVILLPWTYAITYKAGTPWLERLIDLGSRFWNMGTFYLNNRPLSDSILFVVFLGILIWTTAMWAGFSLTRSGKPWYPLIVSAATIIISEFFYNTSRNLFTFAFVFFALLVLASTNFSAAVRKWHSRGTLVEYETGFKVGRSAFLASLVLVFVAWNVTPLLTARELTGGEQRPIADFYDNIRRELARLTGPLEGNIPLQQDFYGDSVGLGTGSVLSDAPVFTVSVDQPRPGGLRYYWRARTYDMYDDGEWSSTASREIPLMAGVDAVAYGQTSRVTQMTFSYESDVNLGLLYTPMYPTVTNLNVKAIADELPNEGIDLSALTLANPLNAGEEYQVTANVTNPLIMEMRAAPEEYPDWVREKYLQLPEDFPDRIRELAEEITGNQDTAYDKAQAVTLYLRNSIQYQEQIPTPPAGVDKIEWFLFELRRGFCNYYATAQVLMLRSVGIPARIVYGYAQGDGDSTGQTFTVIRRNSHAWPEVYFPGLGWVEFEPTASQPTIIRLSGQLLVTSFSDIANDEFDLSILDLPSSNDIDPAASTLPENAEVVAERFTPQNLFPFLWYVLFIDLILLYFVRHKRLGVRLSPPVMIESFIRKRGWKTPAWLNTWSTYMQLAPAEKAFASIPFSNYLLGARSNLGFTPAEQVEMFGRLLPQQAENSHKLLAEYHKTLYSRIQGDADLMKSVGKEIMRSAVRERIHLFFAPEDKKDLTQ